MSEHRWEIGFLIGPCTEAEADEFALAMFDASEGRLGAVMTQIPYTEAENPPTPELGTSGERDRLRADILRPPTPEGGAGE